MPWTVTDDIDNQILVRASISAKTGAAELRALIDALTRRAIQSTKEVPCPSDKS